ncbi:hypothetical protein SJAV_09520 [Sulfurisphaera javensis]|uniref:Uncharacterized protein n=1 Tax=Sulfurisphaera javensis TaxID=2049879 RepID=A0AAT9GQ62_9CREN
MTITELLWSFSDYIDRKKEKAYYDFQIEVYAEDIVEIGYFLLTALTNPSNESVVNIIYKKIEEEIELYNSIVKQNTDIEEYEEIIENKLRKLIDALRKNQEEFEREAFKDYSGIFIISYYTIYLDFVTKLYSMLAYLKLARTMDPFHEKKIINLINTTVFVFAIPIIVYLKKGRIMGEITFLQGYMLYFINRDKTVVDPNSLGYKLFRAIF